MDQMDFMSYVVLAASAFWIGLAAWRGLLSLRKMPAMMLVAFLALSGVVAVIGDKTNGLMRVIGPLWSPPPAIVTVTESDIARGWRVERVTTNETYSYEMPTNVVYVGNLHIHGARSSLGNNKIDIGAIRSRGTRDPTADEWSFPLGTNFESFTSFWYFVDGRIRPTPRDASREIRAAGGPMFAMPGTSRLWAAEDSDGSRVLTWENFFVGNAGAGWVFVIKDGNYWAIDRAESTAPETNWVSGVASSMIWKIPVGWHRIAPNNLPLGYWRKPDPDYTEYENTNSPPLLIGGRTDMYFQERHVDVNGTFRTDKFGHWVSRTRWCRVILDGRTVQWFH